MVPSRRILLLAGAILVAVAGCDAARPRVGGQGPLPLEACTRCHGDAASGNAAPPRSLMGKTDTTARGVGAHQAHLQDGPVRQAIACAACHVVPDRLPHANGVVEVTFGGLAMTHGAAPRWSPATTSCSTTYCHGATLGAGGTNHDPQWTVVNGSQAACGTCHGIPPTSGRHPHLASAPGDTKACAACHGGTVKSDGTIDVAGGEHIDGKVDVSGAGCTACHGDPNRAAIAGADVNLVAAPPRDTGGSTATSALGVGAHQAHVAGGPLTSPIACASCHVVPSGTANHPAGASDADKVTFGGLAVSHGAAPRWSPATASCATTYCHGATLGAGGTNHEPQWTKVDGSQAACGSCHSIPPPASTGHVQSTACGSCHSGYTSTSVNIATHVNGKVDVSGGGCTACHGDPNRAAVAGADANLGAAPPRDTGGSTATSALGVGAHQAHVAGGPLTSPIACASCHVVPSGTTNHPAGASDADKVTFGGLAVSHGAAPRWSPATASCSTTYCHGATLGAGGTSHDPQWTKVDGSQAACGTCHSIPPPASTGHVQSTACGSCHTGYTSTSVNVATHVNGTVDVNGLACTSCHGDPNRAAAAGTDPKVQAAPPIDTHGDTATTARGVGAHQAHLTPSAGALAAPLACADCHVVPDHIPHANGVVDVAFGPKARTGGATPTWNGATCATVYCHGSTLGAGGTNHEPQWTKVDGTQAACGSCHSIPPPASTGHIQSTACGSCHSGYSSTSVNIATHVNGKVDVSGGGCTACHGDPNRAAVAGADANLGAAPPRDTGGSTATSALGVGAHQAHVAGGPLTSPIACASCHVVPSGTTNHPAGASDADKVTFGGLAVSHGAAPRWSPATASCSTTYCHGATLGAGGTSHDPQWTKVDGSQAACGTCHSIPPPASTGHVQSTACGSCHTGYTSTSVNVATHVNGTVDVNGLACTSCHGDPNRAAAAGTDPKVQAAPPIDTHGDTATTARGVGAHQAHLTPSAGALAAPLACADCHVVPERIPHANGVVDVAFGPKARTGGATPTWNGATCATVYCHGSTLGAGGTNHEPQWTKVDGTQAACGSCHSIPPPASTGHVQSTACGSCHTGYTSSSVNPALHVNGSVDVGAMTCSSCHGDPNRAAVAGADPRVKFAPPTDAHGSASSAAVGAHQAHVNNAAGLTRPVQCAECHVVPTSIPHANGVVDVQFGGRAVAGGAAPAWSASSLTCSSTYCHGNFPGGKVATMAWNGPGTSCASCHGAPPSSGLHAKHLQAGRVCSDCHGAGYALTGSSGTVNRDTHVDGIVTLTNHVTSWNPATGDCVGCHGPANWFNGGD